MNRDYYDYEITSQFSGDRLTLTVNYSSTVLKLSGKYVASRIGTTGKFKLQLLPSAATSGKGDRADIFGGEYDSNRDVITGKFQASGTSPISYESKVGEYTLTRR